MNLNLYTGKDLSCFFASKDDYIELVWAGFHNEKSEAEAANYNEDILVIDLEYTKLDEAEYLELKDSTTLYNTLFSELKKNGFTEIKDIYIK